MANDANTTQTNNKREAGYNSHSRPVVSEDFLILWLSVKHQVLDGFLLLPIIPVQRHLLYFLILHAAMTVWNLSTYTQPVNRLQQSKTRKTSLQSQTMPFLTTTS